MDIEVNLYLEYDGFDEGEVATLTFNTETDEIGLSKAYSHEKEVAELLSNAQSVEALKAYLKDEDNWREHDYFDGRAWYDVLKWDYFDEDPNNICAWSVDAERFSA